MTLHVAVIGARGRMGAWFVKYFQSYHAKVSAYDSIKGPDAVDTLEFSENLEDCVKTADAVLVCVPVKSTPEVIRKCSRYMRSGATLAEIASVKDKSFTALSGMRKDLLPLCIHPMFGPGATDGRPIKFLFIPVRNAKKEYEKIKGLFGDASVLKIDSPRQHDELMGTVLGLTYFLNLVLADLISDKDVKMLESASGTTFRLQTIIAGSILSEAPELAGALVTENPHALRQIRRYLKSAHESVDLASSDRKMFIADIARLKKKMDKLGIQTSYKNLYQALRAVQG